MSETPAQKQCRIKTSVLTRLQKELARYQEELARQSSKIDGMRASGADEYDVRQQVEVLKETEIIIPDTLRRMERATEDLREFVTANSTDASLAGSPLLAAAMAALTAAEGSGSAPPSASAAAAADDDAI